MTCREVAEFLMDYLDATLPASQRTEFDRHLPLCPACRDYLNSYKATMALGRVAFEDSHLAEPPKELVDAILASRKAKSG